MHERQIPAPESHPQTIEELLSIQRPTATELDAAYEALFETPSNNENPLLQGMRTLISHECS